MTSLRLAVVAGALLFAGCAEFHAAPPPGAPKGSTWAKVDGVELRYKDVGQGPPVVLVHGFASALETWARIQPELAKKRRVLSLDLKGFGYSARPEGDYSPQAEAKLVLGLMKARGIEQADVVGHSWGSSVVLAMALEAPSRVHKIALYDAWVYEEQLPSFFLWARSDGVGEALFALFYDERPDERIAHAFFDKEKWVSEPLVEDIELALERPGTKAAALAAARGQHYLELAPRYKKIQQPTLLLWGENDEVSLLSYGQRLSRDLPHARLVTYPRCGHFPMLEAEAESTRELASFLDAAPVLGAPSTPAKDDAEAKK